MSASDCFWTEPVPINCLNYIFQGADLVIFKRVPTKDKRGFPFLRTPTPHPTPHGPTLFFTSKNIKVNCSYYNKYALNFLTFSMNIIIFLLSSSIVLTGESNYKTKTFYMCKTYTGERSSNKQNSRCFTCCEEKSYHSWKGIGLP